MEFRLLGRLEVVDGLRDVPPRRRKQRALLALLLLRTGETVTVDEVIDALWGVRPPPAARNAVQGHIATLRKLLGRDRIATHGSGYTLRLDEDELDLHRFERLVSVQRPDVRLVTLTGTGGTGKTRLAIEAAAALVDTFADGVVFVGLAPLQDPDLVPTTAAAGSRGRRNQWRDARGGSRPSSAEPRAPAGVRQLRASPRGRTVGRGDHSWGGGHEAAGDESRSAPLRLSAEHLHPVSPLATPTGAEDVDHLRRCESVALFEMRAQAVRPDFAVTSANAGAVADVCRALDGLPLAIELAASRVGALPPAAMRRRLDHPLKLLVGGAQDAPERQRTLRATIVA